jgi:antitoxin HicB
MKVNSMEYPIVIAPISEEDGGGYMAFVTDLPGCMSDGDTPNDAAKNACVAAEEWIAESKRLGRDIPAVGSSIERLKAERKSVFDQLDRLQQQLSAYDDIDNRINDLRSEIQHIVELLEDQHDNDRFFQLTGRSLQSSIKHSII